MAVVYSALDPQGRRVDYRDRKRLWWSLSVVYPLLPFAGMAAHAASGREIALALPLVISYGLLPLLDLFIGEDEKKLRREMHADIKELRQEVAKLRAELGKPSDQLEK